LHLGQFNPRYSYTIEGVDVEKAKEEKDLGVIIDSELKFHARD